MKAALERLLLVEDDKDIRTIATMSLEMVGGLKVRACESGPAGLAALGEFDVQLVLLDVMMPGMSGPEFLEALRATEKGKDLPVVFMTAKVQPEQVRALMKPGVLDIIAKPFDPMTLAEEVKAIWERRGEKES